MLRLVRRQEAQGRKFGNEIVCYNRQRREATMTSRRFFCAIFFRHPHRPRVFGVAAQVGSLPQTVRRRDAPPSVSRYANLKTGAILPNSPTPNLYSTAKLAPTGNCLPHPPAAGLCAFRQTHAMVEVLLAEMKSKGSAPAETPAKIHRQNHAPGYELSLGGTASIRADFKVFRGNASLPHLFQNAERPVRRRRDGGNPRGKLFYLRNLGSARLSALR